MKQVVMIGPSPRSRGGMATVIAIYLAHGYENGQCTFIETQADGGKWVKLLTVVGAFWRVLVLLLAGRVALLHAHVASGNSFWRKAVFIGLALLFRRPVVFHLHGGRFDSFVAGLSGMRRRVALLLMRRTSVFLVLTRQAAAWVQTEIQHPAIQVFPNPIAALPLTSAPRRAGDLLFIGRIEEPKGIFDLIRAFSMILPRYPAARLIVCGEGESERLQSLARELRVEAAVQLMGWVEGQAKADLLCQAGLYVLASHFEQMPMTVLEAMMARCPVLATRVGAVPDMIDDGVSGTLVDRGDVVQLADALDKAIGAPKVQQQMADLAYQHVCAVYEADNVVARLQALYRQVTQGLAPTEAIK